jgi:VanZ family protein
MSSWRLSITALTAAAGFLARWIRHRVAAQGVAATLGWSPSILYTFGLGIFLLSFRLRRPLRWALALGGVTGALAYEVAQRGLAGRTYDPHDVIATVVGGALAFAVDRVLPSVGPA